MNEMICNFVQFRLFVMQILCKLGFQLEQGGWSEISSFQCQVSWKRLTVASQLIDINQSPLSGMNEIFVKISFNGQSL